MVTSMRRHVIIAALVVFPLLIGAGAASPQPDPVCVLCGDRLETLTADRNLSVDRTTVTIEIDDDGSADWRLTGELQNASAIDYYREHPDELTAAARAVLTDPTNDRPPGGAVSNVEAGVDDAGVLVVRFTQAGFAEERVGGVLFSAYLYEDSTAWIQLTADELVVVPPDGYEFTNAPQGAERLPYRAVWASNDFSEAYLVMATEDDAATNLATRLVLGRQAAPNVLVSIGLVLPGALLLVLLAREAGRLAGRLPRHSRGAELVAGGGALLFVFGLADPTWPLLALGGVGVAAGGLARSGRLADRFDEPTHSVAIVAVVLGIVGFAFSLVSPLWIWGPTEALWRGFVVASFALPAALMLPYGVAIADDRGRHWPWLAGAALLFVALASSDPTRPPGTFAGLFAVFALVGAGVSALVGLPLCWLGRQFIAGDAD